MTPIALLSSIPMAGLSEPYLSVTLASIAVVLAVIAIVLVVKNLNHKNVAAEQPATTPPPAGKAPVAAAPVAPRSTAESEAAFPGGPEPDAPTEEAPTPAPRSRRGMLPSRHDAEAAEASGDYARAAELWRKRANFVRECAALAHTNDKLRRAALLLAFEETAKAAELLRDVLSKNPKDHDTRFQLVYSLLDLGKMSDARQLAGPLLETGEVGTDDLLALARGFEAVRQFKDAVRVLQLLIERSESTTDAEMRLVYLKQLDRIARIDLPGQNDEARARMISKALEETGVSLESNAGASDSPALNPLEPYSVVVGHLALGGKARESWRSVRSRVSPASRFQYKRVIGERQTTTVFEAVDRLLDCTVAVRLSRVSTQNGDFDHLRQRLVAISQLNHPNLSKLAFVDRFGKVVRVVSEYHNGGNLILMMERMEKIGLPMMLRILIQAASALATAHRAGVLHGDVRPENILIGHDNLVKVVDFALQPWPVRGVRLDDSVNVRNLPEAQAQEIQSDIAQFADLIEFLLERATVFDSEKIRESGYDPVEELREVIARARSNSFSTIQHIERILGQVLNRLIPGSIGS